MPETLEKVDRAQTLDWRRQKAATLARTTEHREFDSSGLELREADDGTLTLTGYASVYERAYPMGWFTERIARNAGRRTLGESPDVQLLVNHTGLPLARTVSGTLRLSEDEFGLLVEADLDPEDPDVQRLVRKMKRGDIDQMSFAFRVTDDVWNDDLTERTIKSYSIHRGDVSVVNMGANEAASASVRSLAVDALAGRTCTDVVGVLHEVRAGKRLSSSSVEVLTSILGLTRDAETAAGDAAALLDDFINPTEDSEDVSVERSIDSEKGLHRAIRSALRTPDSDEERAAIVTRAAELDLPGLVPDCWGERGTLSEGRALETQEQRETFNDTYTALQGALDDVLVTNGDYYYVWIQDFDESNVYYVVHGELFSAPYTLVPGGEVTIDLENAVKVRPVTEYVERAADPEPEPEPAPAARAALPDMTTRAAQDFELLMLREARR